LALKERLAAIFTAFCAPPQALVAHKTARSLLIKIKAGVARARHNAAQD
jgi:hypothetical protein